MTLGIARRIVEIREVLGRDTETMTVGTTVFVDRPITIQEKKVLTRRVTPQRMKNIIDRDEARIEL